MVKVKICGITNKDDAFKAVKCGADALGFIFYKKSPRYISPSKARAIIELLPPFISPVGVFVNDRIGAICDIAEFCGLSAIQLHGDEDHHYCSRFNRYGIKVIKAFRVSQDFDPQVVSKYNVHANLFDAYQDAMFGGTGKVFNWEILKGLKSPGHVILSGGLNPENVRDAIEKVKPYAVDVSSGVESEPGKKDHRKLEEFLRNVYS